MAASRWWNPRVAQASRLYPVYLLAFFVLLAVILHFFVGDGWEKVGLTAIIAVVLVTILWLVNRYYPWRKG